MKVNLFMGNLKVMEYIVEQMEENIKVIGRKEKQMDKECKLALKEMFMKVNFLMENLKVMEYIGG